LVPTKADPSNKDKHTDDLENYCLTIKDGHFVQIDTLIASTWINKAVGHYLRKFEENGKKEMKNTEYKGDKCDLVTAVTS